MMRGERIPITMRDGRMFFTWDGTRRSCAATPVTIGGGVVALFIERSAARVGHGADIELRCVGVEYADGDAVRGSVDFIAHCEGAWLVKCTRCGRPHRCESMADFARRRCADCDAPLIEYPIESLGWR